MIGMVALSIMTPAVVTGHPAIPLSNLMQRRSSIDSEDVASICEMYGTLAEGDAFAGRNTWQTVFFQRIFSAGV